MGLFDSIGGMLGLGSDPSQQQPQAQQGQQGQAGQNGGQSRLALAQALMSGGGSGAPANSFMGGLSQGLSPLLRMQMMQHMLSNPSMLPGAQQTPPQAPAAPQQQEVPG